MFDLSDRPKAPRAPFYILNGIEVVHGVGIGDDLDGVARSNITIDIRPSHDSTSVLNYVSVI